MTNNYNLNLLLDALSEVLNITKTQFDNAVTSYSAIGTWLTKGDQLRKYNPVIRPQGSFLLGTMIQPIVEDDDLDIDLVCQLDINNMVYVQKNVKDLVGGRIREHNLYQDMLDKEGRRCWTLHYRDNAGGMKEKYHLDILPCAVNQTNYEKVLESKYRSIDGNTLTENRELSISITDNTREDYITEKDKFRWNQSNPFGYGIWFFNRAFIGGENKSRFLNESVKPVPKYSIEKLPLQKIVQILKRHRDVMFEGNEDKPISIIITTLSAKAYKKEEGLFQAFERIITDMNNYIEVDEVGNKVVSNPSNSRENFADKWKEKPSKKESFYMWTDKLKKDLASIKNAKSQQEAISIFERVFGEKIIKRTIENYGSKLLKAREKGNLRMATSTGILNDIGEVQVTQHKPYGK